MQLIEKYFTKGEILEAFGGKKYKDASKNPDLQFYMNDPVWLQLYQMKQQQAAMQQQMEAQKQSQGQVPGQPGGDPAQKDTNHTNETNIDPENIPPQDLDSALSQLEMSLSKSEKGMTHSKKELFKRMNLLKKNVIKQYEKDAKDVAEKLLINLEKNEPFHICTEECNHQKRD